ncbi:MAG TPA: hypothetical protein VK891_07180, partial [Euzebyales bacterium]|nr:hypothetical protein [Euzebyales bacterium]
GFEFTGAVIDRSATSGSASRARTTVNRKDWGGNWNAALEAGGVLVSVKVTLEFRRVRYPDRGSASNGTMLPLLARG